MSDDDCDLDPPACAALEAMHAHHRLLAQQIAQIITDYRDAHERLDRDEARMSAIEMAVRESAATVRIIDKDIRELFEVFTAVRGGFKVLAWLGAAGKALVWIAIPAGAVLILWEKMKGGWK